MTQTIKATVRCLLPGLCLVGAFSSVGYCLDALPVQLAKLYRSDMNVSAFLVSEQYDGIRAVWKNGRLQTRNGEPIHAPDWFTESLPKTWLDGELLKTHMDDEAVVIGHLPGKGKYTGMMGAIKVRWIDDTGKAVVFKIGTGFSDRDRAFPHGIGSTITFKYYGVTKKGIPKFASYLRQRTSFR